ncbi:MAG: hypothetical protein KDC16_09915, partial [Saprospiraceae bacterium]|nr:hypothetical protein [Saprospiraceae bacterium]
FLFSIAPKIAPKGCNINSPVQRAGLNHSTEPVLAIFLPFRKNHDKTIFNEFHLLISFFLSLPKKKQKMLVRSISTFFWLDPKETKNQGCILFLTPKPS